MKTITFIKLLIWFILTFSVIDLSFWMISTNFTFLNIIGFVLIAIYVFISAKTKCFTTIKITQK